MPIKIPVNIEQSLWELLSKLPKDECYTIGEFSKVLVISREKIKNKLRVSERLQHCKIPIDGGKERTGYINPKYVR